jgi:hypothetical protein
MHVKFYDILINISSQSEVYLFIGNPLMTSSTNVVIAAYKD